MNIEMPLRASNNQFICERDRNDPNDKHTAIFDAKQGCVAHVFDVGMARKMALAVNHHDELCSTLQTTVSELSRIVGDLDAIAIATRSKEDPINLKAISQLAELSAINTGKFMHAIKEKIAKLKESA
jgi:hypothetical protein